MTERRARDPLRGELRDRLPRLGSRFWRICAGPVWRFRNRFEEDSRNTIVAGQFLENGDWLHDDDAGHPVPPGDELLSGDPHLLQHHVERSFEASLDGGQQRGADRAVHYAMVRR